jgi:hypothetical protein
MLQALSGIWLLGSRGCSRINIHHGHEKAKSLYCREGARGEGQGWSGDKSAELKRRLKMIFGWETPQRVVVIMGISPEWW